MGKRNDDNAFYWRSIRLYKVNLIRHALHRTEGSIRNAALELGISEGGLYKEITALEATGLHVREDLPDGAKSADSGTSEGVSTRTSQVGESDDG